MKEPKEPARYPFKGAFCGTLGVLAAFGVVYLGYRAGQIALELAQVARYEFSPDRATYTAASVDSPE